jgi:hypothetical protein
LVPTIMGFMVKPLSTNRLWWRLHRLAALGD